MGTCRSSAPKCAPNWQKILTDRRSLIAGLASVAAIAPFGLACAAPPPPAPMTTGLQVLGSGGPLADDDRAGSGYLVWIDGKARLLIDSGSGIFTRFGASGADFNDLDAILLSHFHVDHVADLDALLMSGSFSARTRPLTIVGPTGSDYFQGIRAYLEALFGRENGAYPYLSFYLDGEGGRTRLDPVEVAADGGAAEVFKAPGLNVTAIPVRHLEVPALGYRVETGARSIVFAGDQNEFSDLFEETLAGSAPDILVAHHAIPEGPGQPRGLHRPPSAIGALAARLGAKHLLLSHNMQRALVDKDRSLTEIAKTYKGKVTIAEDMMRLPFAQ